MELLSTKKQLPLKCDVCGKFIAYDSFYRGVALRSLLTPDSHYTKETYITLCHDHYDNKNIEDITSIHWPNEDLFK